MATKVLWNEAINLLRELNPNETEEKIKKLATFGFSLVVNPWDYIAILREQTNLIRILVL